MKKLIKWIWVFIRTQYRNLGVFLFSGFFQKLYHAKVSRARMIKIQAARIARMKKQGMKLYEFYGVKVWAQNSKNAERKAYHIAFHSKDKSQRNK